MKNTLIFISVSILALFLFSCKKDKEDKEKPYIGIVEPTQGDTQSLSKDPEVHIEFTASDNDEIHEVSVNLTNSADSLIYINSKDVDNTVYSFHEHIVPTGIKSLTKLTLKIEASDHHSNTASKTLQFYIKP